MSQLGKIQVFDECTTLSAAT